MLPVLFDFKFIKIYTFGIFLVLGFFWSLFVFWKNIRLTSYKEEEMFDGVFLSIFFGLFFSRFVYVILNFKDFGFNFLKFILINGYPGLSLIGFIFGFILFLYLFFLSKKINFFEAIDYFITSFFTMLFFGKMGSFFSGEEVGTITNFFLKTRYLGFNGFRHLTAFYEGLFFVIGGFIAQKILFEIRKERFFRGFLFYFAIWYFSLITFLFDKLKENHLYFLKYSFNFIVSGFFLLTTSFYFVYYFRSSIFAFLKISKNYGQKIIEKIYFRAKRKVIERKKEKSSAD